MKQNWRRNVGFITLLLLGAINVYPLLWMIFGSFKTQQEIFSSGLQLLPNNWRPDYFIEAWIGASFGRYFLNTVIVATTVTILVSLITSMAGYVLGKYKIPGKKFIVFLLLS